MGLSTLFADFACWSTVVGLPHIANAKNIKWRLFWWVIFLVLLGVFCYELWLMISTLLSYPSAVATEILYEEQRFPVITICNQNPYKKSVVTGNAAFADIAKMLEFYHNASIRILAAGDAYGFAGVQQDDYLLQWRGTTWLSMLAAKMSVADLSTAMYSYDDLVAECKFNGQTCSSSDFTQYVDPIYGFCYSFNNDKSLNYSTNRAGMKFGLKMLITPKQTLAVQGSPQDYIATTWLAGARVYIGAPGEYQQVFGAGMDLAVGYQAGLALSSSKIVRAPPPCGECNDNNGAANYYSDYDYSMETCFDTCRQVLNQKTCSCSNPRYPKLAADSYCTTSADVDCMMQLQGDQSSATNPNPNLKATCGCTPPCEESNFGVTMSLSKFPAVLYRVATGNPLDPPCDGTGAFGPWINSCRDWYAANAVQLIVYFESLKSERYTEDCSYTIQDLINDLGGHAGLWLGLSVISVVEVAGLVLLLLCYCVTGGKYKIRPSDTEYSKDARMQDLDDMDRELDEKDRHHESLRRRAVGDHN